MVSCLKQGSEMCNFRRVVLISGVAAYTPLCTPVPRMSKLNKKQKQNRETKKKSKRYIKNSKVNTGAVNGSIPQNICSSGQVLLDGRCGRNNMSLERKCCWEKDNLGCLRGFDV